MKRYIALRLVVLALFVATSAPAALFAQQHPSTASARAAGDHWSRTDLFFGTAKADGTAVSDAEFKSFLDQVITPRFPDGLTVLAGFGQFRTSAGVIQQERSMLLILLYPPSKDSSQKIEEIRTLYKEAIRQEAVLLRDKCG